MEAGDLGALSVPPLGVGAWAWGDRLYWRYGKGYGLDDVREAFEVSLEAGVTFFDTAEIYGFGASERILGDLVRSSGRPLIIASKYAPFPWRISARSVGRALDASLKRLGLDHIDLYQVHFPFSLVPFDALMGALADAVKAGKTLAVGVSNYSAEKMRRAHEALARRGVRLYSNQVSYSLLRRTPEVDGVLDACRELGVTLIAYGPLAQGILTGKFPPGTTAPGVRRFRSDFRGRNLKAAEPVVSLLKEIGQAHGRTPGQVALSWLLRQEGVVPIPGAKNRLQAAENAGALGWEMAAGEAEALDRATLPWRR